LPSRSKTLGFAIKKRRKWPDRLNAEWTVAFSAYREEFNRPMTAMQYIRAEGISMFGEVN